MGMVGRIFEEDHYTLLHRNMKALGLVVLEKKIFYVFFSIVSLWELMTPGTGPFLTPEAWLAEFIKRTTIHCYVHTNMKDLGLVVSEKIFLCFSHDAPGSRLAGVLKSTTIR